MTLHDFRSTYGPWALVAGASEGLGAAFAEELADRGLNLILIARRLEKLNALADRLRKNYGIDIRIHAFDLADIGGIKSYLNQTDMNIGLMVYNAAFSPVGNFSDIPEDDLQKVVDVNIRAPLVMARILLPHLKERKHGGIVFMSSLAGMQGSPKIAAYAASKAFNTILAEGLWCELKEQEIDVLASCPGAVSTPGYQNAQHGHAPGTLRAAKVAKDTLDALGKGPVIIPGFTNKLAQFFMSRIFPRRMAISIMEKNTKNLS